MKVENLKAYLANIGMKLKDFCEIIDCDIKHMSRVINGHKTAGRRLAKDVREATSGIINLKTNVTKRHIRAKEQENKKKEQEQQKDTCLV